MKTTLIISAIQQPCNEDRQTNLDYSIAKIHEAAAANADLVVLPELHLGPYFCQNEDYNNFDLAQTIPGPTTEILSAVAKKLKMVIVSTLFEKRAPGLYHNTAVVFDKDGSIAGKYRKMHIPDSHRLGSSRYKRRAPTPSGCLDYYTTLSCCRQWHSGYFL